MPKHEVIFKTKCVCINPVIILINFIFFYVGLHGEFQVIVIWGVLGLFFFNVDI